MNTEEITNLFNNFIEAFNKLNDKVNKLQVDVTEIGELRDHVDNLNSYFYGMGDISQSVQDILTGALEKHDSTNMLVANAFQNSSEFYKKVVSQKYAFQNIMQEWFTDVVALIISEYSPEINAKYVEQWLDLKFKDFVRENADINPSTLPYLERVDFGEKVFALAMLELNMSEFGQFVLRSMYIPYTSLYYLQPFLLYPYIDEWILQSIKFKQ